MPDLISFLGADFTEMFVLWEYTDVTVTPLQELIHLGLDKMAAILQTTYSNVFPWKCINSN